MLRNIILLIICLTMSIIACGEVETDIVTIEPQGDLYPIAKGGKWGYIDSTGAVIIRPHYDGASTFTDGVAVVWKGMRTSLIDEKGNVIFSNISVQLSSSISEGMVLAIKNRLWWSKFGFVNSRGEVAVPFKYDMSLGFSEGLALVHKNGKAGYINKSGNWVIEPKYGLLSYNFHDGLALVTVVEGEAKGKRGFINKEGNFVIEPVYDWAESFSDGLAVVLKSVRGEGGYEYIKTDGTTAFRAPEKPEFPFPEGLGPFSEGLAMAIGENLRYGYLDKNGEFVIEPRFDDGHSFSEGLAAVRVEGKWGYIDKTGEIVIEPVFYSVRDFRNGLAQVYVGEKGKKMAYINKTGEYIWGPE